VSQPACFVFLSCLPLQRVAYRFDDIGPRERLHPIGGDALVSVAYARHAARDSAHRIGVAAEVALSAEPVFAAGA
jgi:hypothetical protein